MSAATFILRTSRGANALAFDSLAAAREAKAAHERRVGIRFRIIEQIITEREVA